MRKTFTHSLFTDNLIRLGKLLYLAVRLKEDGVDDTVRKDRRHPCTGVP